MLQLRLLVQIWKMFQWLVPCVKQPKIGIFWLKGKIMTLFEDERLGFKIFTNEVVMFTQSWGYWVLNRLRKIVNYWVLNLEYSISSNSELILSAQKVNISYYNIEYTISLNSEHQLSTQYLNFLCNYWVYNFVWTLNCEHI